jgi:hypothetical protein
MLERNLDTKEAPTKWWAAQDARMRNLANKSHYTEQTQIRVERMIQALGLCYNARGIHEAFGKRGVSVKVDRPTSIKDRVNLRLLEQDWEAAGVSKKVSPQGVIYRFSAD